MSAKWHAILNIFSMAQEVSSVQAIKPLRDHIVVQAQPQETMTLSGIVLPSTASKEKPQTGTVMAVGPGKMVDGSIVPLSVKVGDVVLFSKYSPTEVKVKDEDYLILREEDVLAVLA
jgi:chaperonin GroES